MSKIKLFLLLTMVFTMVSLAGQVTVTGYNLSLSKYVGTYANNQIDTVIYTREAGISGLAFGLYTKDSVSITNVVLRRVINGVVAPVVAGDTLLPTGNAAYTYTFAGTADYASTNTTFTSGNSFNATITLAPIPDQFLFIVKYAATANGYSQPTVRYEVIKQFSTTK